MSSFQIIIGSMLGTSEYVAEACQETLISLGHQAELHFQPNFSQIPQQNQTWLICTSTHGAGDPPDNLINFIEQVTQCDQKLSSTKLITIALGDSNYDTFCYAGINLNNLLISKGLTEILTIKKLDMSLDIDPEEQAQQWLVINKDHL